MRILVAGLLLAGIPCLVPLRADEAKEPDLPTRLKSVKGPFTLVVHFQVKKGEEKTLLEAARPCVTATRKEKGCIAYEMHQDQEDPTKFVFYERWKSTKDLEAHLAAEHTKKLVGIVGKIATGAPKFSFYTLTE